MTGLQFRRVKRSLIVVAEFIDWLIRVHPQPWWQVPFGDLSFPNDHRINISSVLKFTLYVGMVLESHLWKIRKPLVGKTLRRLELDLGSKRKDKKVIITFLGKDGINHLRTNNSWRFSLKHALLTKINKARLSTYQHLP